MKGLSLFVQTRK